MLSSVEFAHIHMKDVIHCKEVVEDCDSVTLPVW